MSPEQFRRVIIGVRASLMREQLIAASDGGSAAFDTFYKEHGKQMSELVKLAQSAGVLRHVP